MKKILLALLIATSMFAFPAKIVKFIDGDTITVQTLDGNLSKLRFADVDTPEKFTFSFKAKSDIKKCGIQTVVMGKMASAHLNAVIKLGDTVEVIPTGDTSHDRDVAVIYLGNINLNKMMVQDGYAIVWHTGRDMTDQKYKTELLNAEQNATTSKSGLWNTNPVEMKCLMDYHK